MPIPTILRRGLCALACSLAFAAVSARAQEASPDVQRAVRADGSARVLIALRPPATAAPGSRARSSALVAAQGRVLARVGAKELQGARRFKRIPALAGTVSAAGLARLMADPEVLRVDLDVGGSGTLATSVPQINADQVQDVYGFDGSGVTVAVLDSGFDSDHPDLASALVDEQCFCSGGGGCCPGGGTTRSGAGAAEDDHTHGTHVSGIISSDGVVAPRGVAPGANIVAVKVLDSNNQFCCTSDVIAGLDWIIDNRPDVRVVNMSLCTFATFAGDCDNATAYTMAFADAINTLTDNGVAVFAASCNLGLPAAMGAPACVANTISVGAVNSSDAVASFSNSSTTLDLLAPGVGIVSSMRGGGSGALSGTSMAAPHAAGTAALLLEAFPWLTPAELLRNLKDTGVPVTDPKNDLTTPRIDALAALLYPRCGNGTTDPGEQCDDGNFDSGDGCDSDCTLTGCGNGIVTSGETCDDGIAGSTCCSPTCTLVDSDGDGVCDRDDGCPNVSGVFDPAPMDSIKKVLLVYKSSGPGGGDDAPKIVDAVFSTGSSFEPDETHTVHVALINTGTGGRVFSATLPAGGLWRQPNLTKRRWLYKDLGLPTTAGVKKFTLKESPAGSGTYKLQLAGRTASIEPANAPLNITTDHLKVRVEIESGGSGVCLAETLTNCVNAGMTDRCM